MSVDRFHPPDGASGGALQLSARPLFDWPGVLAVAAGLGVSLWLGYELLIAALALLLCTLGLSWLWSRLSLRGLRWQRVLTQDRAFPGEEVGIGLRLENRKPLPLPWVEVTDGVPVSLLAEGQADGVVHAASLLWYRAITWRHRLYCRRRGYYPIGPAWVTSGDIFGLYPRQAVFTDTDHIIVYPRLFPLAELGLPSAYPMGEAQARHRLFQDPSRSVGIRDYTPHDPLKHIHWKASARQGQLQVRVFEPTTSLKVVIFLAVDSFAREEDLELAISAAASVAYRLIEGRSSVGLLANTRLPLGGEPIILPTGSGREHLVRILEALAKAAPQASVPFEEFVHAQRGGLPWGATLIFIHDRPGPTLRAMLEDLRARGHKMTLFHVAEMPETASYDIPRYRLRHPGGLVAGGMVP